MSQDQEAVKKLISEINALIARIAFAAIFSHSIHRFSHLWYDGLKDDVIKPILVEKEQVIQELAGELHRVKIRLKKIEHKKRALKADFEEKVEELVRLEDDLNDVKLEICIKSVLCNSYVYFLKLKFVIQETCSKKRFLNCPFLLITFD